MRDPREGFIGVDRDRLAALSILHVYYSGPYFRSRPLFLLSTAAAMYAPFAPRRAYSLVLRKNGPSDAR